MADWYYIFISNTAIEYPEGEEMLLSSDYFTVSAPYRVRSLSEFGVKLAIL